MGDLGERLRRERESKGISLGDIARQTRIGVRLLKAIEQEAFDQLPGGIFNKSFIQQYAHCLGLNEKDVVRDYLRMTASAREIPYPPPVSPSRASRSVASKAMFRLSMGAAALMLVVLVVWLMLPQTEPEAGPPIRAMESPASQESRMVPAIDPDSVSFSRGAEPSAATRITASAPDEKNNEPVSGPPTAAPVHPASEPVAAAELLMADGDREPLTGELPQELLLQISAHSTVWISITADGERQWQGTLQPNQSREVEAAETIRLTVGNAGGVELTLNGKNLGALGREGEVKTVTLAARALQDAVP